jgi:integrase
LRTFPREQGDLGDWPMRDAKSPFTEHIDGFFATKRKLAPKTRVDYLRYFREFDKFTGHLSLEEALTLDNATRWIDEVGQRGPFAARNATMYLKSMATWAKKSRYLSLAGGTLSVLAGLEAPEVPPSTRDALSDAQLEAIWKVLSERPNRDRSRATAYLWLLLTTGLRRNEARQLALCDMHLDLVGVRSWVLVRWQTSKGSKERKTRMDRAAVGPIHEYLANHRPMYTGPKNKPEPILLTEAGKPFTENGFGSWAGRVFDDIEKGTGIRCSSHIYRHTWATQYHRASRETGLTVYDLKEEGGWADLNTPLRYTHTRPFEELLDAPTAFTALRKRRMAGTA